jgi:hypothetical protein
MAPCWVKDFNALGLLETISHDIVTCSFKSFPHKVYTDVKKTLESDMFCINIMILTVKPCKWNGQNKLSHPCRDVQWFLMKNSFPFLLSNEPISNLRQYNLGARKNLDKQIFRLRCSTPMGYPFTGAV